jgi:hypothetical protein
LNKFGYTIIPLVNFVGIGKIIDLIGRNDLEDE